MDNFLEEFKKLKEKVEALEKRTLSSLKLDSLTTGIIKPSSDSNSAIKITKADGETNVLSIDTINNRVGINTISPLHNFQVYRTSLVDPSLTFTTNATAGIRTENIDIVFGAYMTHPWAAWIQARHTTNQAWSLVINPLGGNVGIGTNVPSEKLEVNGNVKVSGIKVSNGVFRSLTRSDFLLVLQSDRNMVLYDNGTAIWSSGTGQSDIRLKKNIKEMESVLENIKKIRVVRFNYKNYQPKKQQIGIIAQELEKYYPEFIFTDKKGYKLIFYDKLTTILIKAIQELSLKVENLEKKYGEINNSRA
jgi:hypothetical protein